MVWDGAADGDVPATTAEAGRGVLDAPPMRGGIAPLHRLGRRLYAHPARRGAGDGAARGRLPPSRRRRPAGARRSAAGGAADRTARGACWPRSPSGSRAARRELALRGRCRRRRDPRHGRCRAAGRALLPAAPPFGRARPGASRPDPVAGPGRPPPRPARRRWRRGEFSVTLLDGVTGSGKTEVYLEAVAECPAPGPPGAGAAAGNRAVRRNGWSGSSARFGVAPAVWHSDLDLARPPRSPGARWRTARAPVVVGARSALFLPFPDLGLIVVDEEHETAFKQEDGVIYHARDMAVVRARFCAAPRPCWSPPRPAWRRRQRRGRPLPPAASADAPWRRGAARGDGDRLARHPPERGQLPRPAADRRRCARPWRAASRRCCSSTAAAMRR